MSLDNSKNHNVKIFHPLSDKDILESVRTPASTITAPYSKSIEQILESARRIGMGTQSEFHEMVRRMADDE